MGYLENIRNWASRASRPAAVAFLFELILFQNLVFAETYEIGVQFSGTHLHKIDEEPLGIGARLDYNFLPLIAADLEVMHYPENPSGNFGETTVLLGARLGKHFDRFGVFGKVRPGVIHFGGAYFTQRLEQKTRSMLDVGGELEYYPNRRTVLRLDLDDAVIYYGNSRLFNRPNPDALGTVHNLKPGFGIGIRF